jgi:hypothetical protein
LRPRTTIVICEDGAKSFPFDVNHVLVRQYHHMGEGIDFDEVERFRAALTGAIRDILAQDPPSYDSPVYTFLNGLTPPALAAAMQGVAVAVAKAAPVVDAAAASSLSSRLTRRRPKGISQRPRRCSHGCAKRRTRLPQRPLRRRGKKVRRMSSSGPRIRTSSSAGRW